LETLDLLWLVPAFPLAGSIVLLVAGRKLGRPWAGWLATLMCAGAFATTVVMFVAMLGLEAEERHHVTTLFDWIDVGGLDVDVAFLADPLSITMALFVTGIGSLIHLYSIGYMAHDERFPAFFLYLNLFAFSMLTLVLADNFVLTFLGWEGVGACSYFLISFWFTRERAAVAGKKAFVTNRIGDFGFMVATFLVFGAVGSLDYLGVFGAAEEIATTTATAIGLLLFLGAAGKSAQLPLFVWLPDAMEGPTPVSALIHAATMVTAGVYLLCRVAPILEVADPATLTTIGLVGGATALFAAVVACAQDDIKRVLAYSTVSQLGYMVLAVGTGSYVAAIFHMVTHAFFKALLFLGAGSVIHGLHDEQDMKRMGGLRRWMPVTYWTFLAGWLAIAGVFPFAGFWSKDEILLGAWTEGGGAGYLLWGVGLVTALLTAYYMSRQVFLVFYGDERWRHPAEAGTPDKDDLTLPEPPVSENEGAAHGAGSRAGVAPVPSEPHESPWTMTVPLVVLAALSIAGGALNLPFGKPWLFLEHWLEPSFGEALHAHDASGSLKFGLAVAALAAALAGVAVAYVRWCRLGPEDNAALEPAPLRRALYLDSLYAALFGGPGRWLADKAAYVVDLKVVDGAVNGAAAIVRAGGGQLRKLQTGYVRNYALGVAAGVVLLLAWTAMRVAA
jgi:NADH-quinone oxidoreductase subunit L